MLASMKRTPTLKKLGWAAKLSQGEDWVVQLFPLPERQFPSFNLTFLLCGPSLHLPLTLAGAYWMEGSRPSGGWFHDSILLGCGVRIHSSSAR